MHYRDALKSLTVKELVRAIGGERLTSVEKRHRDRLVLAIDSCKSFQEAVLSGYDEKRIRQEDYRNDCVKRCKIECQVEAEVVDEGFLQDVGEDVRNEVLSRFLDRMGNEALSQVICVVCAGEFFKTDARECDL